MYVDADFLLALIAGDDWRGVAAEDFYEDHREDLRTSRVTLVELLFVAAREGWDALTVVANARQLVRIDDDVDDVLAAASYVEDHDLSPFAALHLVAAGDDPIVFGDDYGDLSERLALATLTGDDETEDSSPDTSEKAP